MYIYIYTLWALCMEGLCMSHKADAWKTDARCICMEACAYIASRTNDFRAGAKSMPTF